MADGDKSLFSLDEVISPPSLKTQPKTITGINWANPLTKDLQVAYVPGFLWVDGSLQSGPILDNSITSYATSNGKRNIVSSAGSAPGGIKLDNPFLWSQAPGSSLFCYCLGTSGGSGNAAWVGYATTIKCGYTSLGNPAGFGFAHSTAMVAGQEYMLSYGYEPVTGFGYVGLNDNFETFSNPGYYTAQSISSIGTNSVSGYGRGKQTVFLILVFKRQKTISEAKLIANNPWQLFKSASDNAALTDETEARPIQVLDNVSTSISRQPNIPLPVANDGTGTLIAAYPTPSGIVLSSRNKVDGIYPYGEFVKPYTDRGGVTLGGPLIRFPTKMLYSSTKQFDITPTKLGASVLLSSTYTMGTGQVVPLFLAPDTGIVFNTVTVGLYFEKDATDLILTLSCYSHYGDYSYYGKLKIPLSTIAASYPLLVNIEFNSGTWTGYINGVPTALFSSSATNSSLFNLNEPRFLLIPGGGQDYNYGAAFNFYIATLYTNVGQATVNKMVKNPYCMLANNYPDYLYQEPSATRKYMIDFGVASQISQPRF